MADQAQTDFPRNRLEEAVTMLERVLAVEPSDLPSLLSIKNAQQKLGDKALLIAAGKRLAKAYVVHGQADRAFAEYQALAKDAPMDTEISQALRELKQAGSKAVPPEPSMSMSSVGARVAEGNKRLSQLLIEEHLLKGNEAWALLHLLNEVNRHVDGEYPSVPLLFLASERNGLPLENLMAIVAERSRLPFMPIENFELVSDSVSQLVKEIAWPHCIVPVDRIGKRPVVVTANPFDEEAKQAAQKALQQDIIWFLASPVDMLCVLRGKVKIEPAKVK